MLQQPEPGDYVIATGRTSSVKDFCEIAFGEVGLDYRDFVRVDDRFYRPADVDLLIGDAAKAKKQLGWEPKKTLKDLVVEMVNTDLEDLKQQSA